MGVFLCFFGVFLLFTRQRIFVGFFFFEGIPHRNGEFPLCTQGNTIITQNNRQAIALHYNRPLASGFGRGIQLQCGLVWGCSSLLLAPFKQENDTHTFKTAKNDLPY